jgi:hypothetical protein
MLPDGAGLGLHQRWPNSTFSTCWVSVYSRTEVTPEPAALVGTDPAGYRDETPSVAYRGWLVPAHWQPALSITR